MNYRLDMFESALKCPICGSNLRIQWTTRVYPVSLQLGNPEVVLHLKTCQRCRFIVYPKDYLELSPKHSFYAYDIMVEIGMLRLKNMSDMEIAVELRNRYFMKISPSTISFLANRFYDYFASTHYSLNKDKIRKFIEKQGGYIIHLDGTCEAGTDLIFSIIDGTSNIVLTSTKMKSENKADIIRLLSECIEMFGLPLAIVSDLSNIILNAVKEIIPSNIPQYVCQFHFIESMGDAMFKEQYSNLSKLIIAGKLKSQLLSLRRELGTKNENELLNQSELFSIMRDGYLLTNYKKTKIERSLALSVLKWITDYKSELNGEYFPFSRPEYEFVVRCQKVFEVLKSIFEEENVNDRKFKSTLLTIYEKLRMFFANENLKKCIELLEKHVVIFNEVRTYFRIQFSQGSPVIRQKTNITEEKLEDIYFGTFISEMRERYITDSHYDEIINVVEKYFKMYEKYLSGHRIKNKNDEYVCVDRTNNVIEHFWGKFKHNLRKRIGNANLRRQVHLTHPNATIAQNLLNKDYLNAIGNNCNMETMCKMFHDSEEDTKKRLKVKNIITIRPSYISLDLIRNENFLKNIKHVLHQIVGIFSRAS